MNRGRACLFLLVILPFVEVIVYMTGAEAHESRPAYLEVTETSSGRYEVLWRTPLNAGMRLPVALVFPDDVSNIVEPAVREFSDSLVERRVVG